MDCANVIILLLFTSTIIIYTLILKTVLRFVYCYSDQKTYSNKPADSFLIQKLLDILSRFKSVPLHLALTMLLFRCLLPTELWEGGVKNGKIVSSPFLAHSKNELMQWRGVRRPSVCPSVCKLLRKSLLAHKWPDRHQTFTRWTPGQRASRVCSRSRSKVT